MKKLLVSNIYGDADRKPVSKGEQGKLGLQEAQARAGARGTRNRGAMRANAQSWGPS